MEDQAEVGEVLCLVIGEISRVSFAISRSGRLGLVDGSKTYFKQLVLAMLRFVATTFSISLRALAVL